MMILNIIIGASLCTFCLGELSNSAVSSMSFYQKDVPYSYEYNSVHFYDNVKSKKNLNDNQNRKYYQPQTLPQTYRNIQYAPLELHSEDQDGLKTLYIETTTPTSTELSNVPEPEVTTKKSNIEPQFVVSENQNHNAKAKLQQYVGGHNIKMIRHNIQRSDSNNINAQPIKHIQVLSALENTKIQPVFNAYIKVPRLHLNVARAYNIAYGQYKASGIKQLKFLIHKLKHKPEFDIFIKQNKFLSKNNQ